MIKRFLLVLGLFVLVPIQVSAAAPLPARQVACSSNVQEFFMIQPWYSCLPKDATGHPILTKLNDILLVVFSLVESLVKVGAYVAVFVIFFMIIKMLTARGDTGKIATAGLGIRDALIGLGIAMSSIAIVNFVAGTIK